jgi:hypothetical protein
MFFGLVLEGDAVDIENRVNGGRGGVYPPRPD